MEVGKTYVRKGFTDIPTMEVLFIGKEYAFVRYDHGCETTISKCEWPLFIEHKKPRSGKIFLNVYEGYVEAPARVHVHPTREHADVMSGKKRIACIEVDWVEGQGL